MTSNWAALLQDAIRTEDDEVPPGWRTAAQIAEEIGKSLPHTAHLLLVAVAAGKAQRNQFRITCGSITRRVFHYREVES